MYNKNGLINLLSFFFFQQTIFGFASIILMTHEKFLEECHNEREKKKQIYVISLDFGSH